MWDAFVGLALAATGAHVLQGLMFGVSVRDPLTFGVATAIVIATALVATIVPGLRTLRVDVIAVLNSR